MHLGIYKSRRDVQAIVHTHSQYAIALGLVRQELPAVSVELVHTVGSVPVAPFAPTGTEELAERAASSLGAAGKAVILKRHGVIGIGGGLEEAFLRCRLVERGARTYVLAHSLGWKDD